GMLVRMPEPAGDLCSKLAVLGVDDVLGSVLDRRPRGDETVLLVRVERLGERVVPAQGLKVQRVCLLKESVPERSARSARRCRQEQSLSSEQHLLSISQRRKPRGRIAEHSPDVTWAGGEPRTDP